MNSRPTLERTCLVYNSAGRKCRHLLSFSDTTINLKQESPFVIVIIVFLDLTVPISDCVLTWWGKECPEWNGPQWSCTCRGHGEDMVRTWWGQQGSLQAPGPLPCLTCPSVSGTPANPFVQLLCRIIFPNPTEIWVSATSSLQTLDWRQIWSVTLTEC